MNVNLTKDELQKLIDSRLKLEKSGDNEKTRIAI